MDKVENEEEEEEEEDDVEEDKIAPCRLDQGHLQKAAEEEEDRKAKRRGEESLEKVLNFVGVLSSILGPFYGQC